MKKKNESDVFVSYMWVSIETDKFNQFIVALFKTSDGEYYVLEFGDETPYEIGSYETWVYVDPKIF